MRRWFIRFGHCRRLRYEQVLIYLLVFSLDQDNRNYDLTNAIWDGGALLPTAAEIVSTLVGEPLDENGLVSGEFWVRCSFTSFHRTDFVSLQTQEDVSAQLLQYYANLPVDTMYKVFILIAVWALDEVAGSLYEYLNFSAMTEDSFALYKVRFIATSSAHSCS